VHLVSLNRWEKVEEDLRDGDYSFLAVAARMSDKKHLEVKRATNYPA